MAADEIPGVTGHAPAAVADRDAETAPRGHAAVAKVDLHQAAEMRVQKEQRVQTAKAAYWRALGNPVVDEQARTAAFKAYAFATGELSRARQELEHLVRDAARGGLR